MSTKTKIIAVIIAAAVLMVGTIIGYRKVEGIFNPKKAEPEITTTIVSRQLQTMYDLTTAKENDYGFEEFSEGNIAHVNKKKFTMFYSYEIRAGVDLAKAKIAVDDTSRVISITLPKADLQSVSVDPDSLRFFDSERPSGSWRRRIRQSPRRMDTRSRSSLRATSGSCRR